MNESTATATADDVLLLETRDSGKGAAVPGAQRPEAAATGDGRALGPYPATKVAATGDEDDFDLALENRRLAGENAQLRSGARRQKLDKLLGELRFLGKLTPGLEQAGAAAILGAAYELGGGVHGGKGAAATGAQRPEAAATGVMVELPDGSSLPLGDALAGLLYAIPPQWGGEWGGSTGLQPAYAGGFRPQDAGTTGRPRLTREEREIARTLGLTAEEYAGIAKQG